MQTPNKIKFWYIKVKTALKYYAAVISKGFNTKFVLKAKVEKKSFGNISNFDVCYSSVALSIDFNSKKVFHNSKICRKCKPPKNLDQIRNSNVFAQTA